MKERFKPSAFALHVWYSSEDFWKHKEPELIYTRFLPQGGDIMVLDCHAPAFGFDSFEVEKVIHQVYINTTTEEDPQSIHGVILSKVREHYTLA